jgi:AraC family ethanolamine operon transcriptional activator
MQSLSTPTAALPATLPHGALARARFADIDEQAAALVGWNRSCQQLSCGSFEGALQRLQLDGVGLFIEDLHQAVHQTGWVRPQVVALGVPLVLRGDSQFCGQVGSESALHVFSGGDCFQFRSPQRHAMLGIEVDRALFEAHVLEVLPIDGDAFTAHARLEACAKAPLGQLRGFLLDLFDRATRQPGMLQADAPCAPVRDQVCDELLARLASVLSSTPGAEPSGMAAATRGPNAGHAALAERARQLVMSRLDEPPSVAELCHLLGVSRRTLQSSFRAIWGMGPLAWLNTLRLNAVRRRLKHASSVTDAATQLGFWHFGHFARDYRALFGELPSQTLKRHRAQAGALRH